MKAGYYIDNCGDIAIRYPMGGWHIMHGAFSHRTHRLIHKDDIWFLDFSTIRDAQAKREKWKFIGGL